MDKSWLKNAVIYQIYPSSFYDSNNDGVGDLNGISEKVSYVKSLGVDAIWINPFYKSSFQDGGYDIEDYFSVDKRFGTLSDFEKLINTYHSNGIKVLIDLVVGHTSNKHPWFLESQKNEKNNYSDYYIWTDSIFSTYKNKTVAGMAPRNGCYYANYYACQPALNFGFNKVEYPEWQMKYDDPRLEPLRNEVISIMKFWLSKGVDGFRVDMANSLVKDPHFDSKNLSDNEGNIWLWDKLINGVKKEYPNAVFVAEWINPALSVKYCNFDVDFYAHDVAEFNDLVRNEEGTNLLPCLERGNNYFSDYKRGSFEKFKKRYFRDLKSIGNHGSIALISGNHDEIRLSEKMSEELLKDYFAFILLAKNTPFIYYGDEIGLPHNFNVSKDGGFIRTGCRTPMEWDDSLNSGFSKAKDIYLSVSGKTNVENELKNNSSLLNTVKNLIQIKKKYKCFSLDGDIKFIKNNDVLHFERILHSEKIDVAINVTNKKIQHNLKGKTVLYCEGFSSDYLNAHGFVIYR